MPDGKSHGQHSQAKRQRNAKQTNANLGKRRCQHGTAAPAKHQPESAKKLCTVFFHDRVLLDKNMIIGLPTFAATVHLGKDFRVSSPKLKSMLTAFRPQPERSDSRFPARFSTEFSGILSMSPFSVPIRCFDAGCGPDAFITSIKGTQMTCENDAREQELRKTRFPDQQKTRICIDRLIERPNNRTDG